MKRFTILFIIVIMFNNLINSQINYGIRVGCGVSDVLQDLDKEEIEEIKHNGEGPVYNPIFAFQTGVFLSDTIINHFFWKGELMLSHYGFREYYYDFFEFGPNSPEIRDIS